MTEQERRTLQETMALPYAWSLGPVNTLFFKELTDMKIMGTRCPRCSRVLVPARLFCPRCFIDLTEWVQVSDHGTIRTWTIINFSYAGQPKKPPYINAMIELDGADTRIPHWVGGVDLSDLDKVKEQIGIGTRVKAV